MAGCVGVVDADVHGPSIPTQLNLEGAAMEPSPAGGAPVLVLGRTGRLPCEPIAGTHQYRDDSRIFYTSLGSRENFERPDFQRLLGNAVLWGLRRQVPPRGAFPADAGREVVAAPRSPNPRFAGRTGARRTIVR